MPYKGGDVTGIEARVRQRRPELLHTFVEPPVKCRHGTAREPGDFDHRKALIESQGNDHAVLGWNIRKGCL